jgi:hypothetical protein
VGELAARFVLGGFVVTVFAALGDVLRPRTFAGIFAHVEHEAGRARVLRYVCRHSRAIHRGGLIDAPGRRDG